TTNSPHYAIANDFYELCLDRVMLFTFVFYPSPPASPLFPYTTLFRSPRLGGSPAHQRLIIANLATSLFEHGRITTTEAKARVLRDRKSTRLNSSHSQSSYAVFCLKKKRARKCDGGGAGDLRQPRYPDL